MKKFSIFISTFILAVSSLTAQITTQGKEFWLSYGSNNRNAASAVDLEIVIATQNAAMVSLSFTNNNALNTSYSIPANSIQNIVLTN